MVRSRGPSHCTTSCGSTYARNTSSGGASKSRVTVTSGMPGSAVICVLLMIVSFRCGQLVSVGGLGLIGLKRGEQLIEPLMALIPEPLIPGQPRGHLTQRLGLEMAEPGGRPAGAGDQARILEHLQVLRDGRL